MSNNDSTTKPFQPLRSRAQMQGARASTIPNLGRYRREKVRQLRAARGLPTYVDAEPIRKHIHYLLSIGFTLHSIASAAGVGLSTVRQISLGMYGGSKIDAASRIMAVTHKPVPRQTGQRVPAIGVRRRIHALQAIGWTHIRIGAELGVSASAVSAYSRYGKVHYEVWEAVAAVYERLSGTQGDSALTIHRAKERGFAPPLAWEGLDIDHPDHQPDMGEEIGAKAVDDVLLARILRCEHKGDIPKAERTAALDHAVANNWNRTQVAKALNLSIDAADQALVRHRRKLRKEAA
ncbi:hypothetical protein [Nocardia sp. NPDC057455]|uniref:hypothetical protein n=1 Tax=Nocardia sp. NPDC057455 TaxID=3346138 RepID=UPI00366C8237